MAQRDFGAAALRLSPLDNVAVLKRALRAGETLTEGRQRLRLPRTVPAGHKIATEDIPDGAPVRKCGQVIGYARGRIKAGEHVHTHNAQPEHSRRDCRFCADVRPVNYYPAAQMRYFQGYARPGGRVGTRNYVAVLSTVNCSASVARQVRDRFRTEDFARKFPHVDGVAAFTHGSGCAVDRGEPLAILQRVLVGFARHPNVAGYVMIGLGCEVNNLPAMRAADRLDKNGQRGPLAPVFLDIQACGGTRRTVAAGVAAVARMLAAANRLRRTPQPLSKLVLAENCGGSDGYSGLTANPALGVASDELVRYGGTSVLAETPEVCGAEHLLTRRALSPAVGQQLVALIRWWQEHARLHGSSIDYNPSPGNQAGGLTTLSEKSLGAVAKGGQSPLAAVYRYAEPIRSAGFCFMDTPGYDPVSMTGLVAGGCNIAVFTTGRGSVFGLKPVPCLKVASHTPLYHRMEEDMDFNAGGILDGRETVEQAGLRLFEQLVAVAGGQKTKSELAGVGDEEFVPWHLGPVF
jgi:altronate dehydratase